MKQNLVVLLADLFNLFEIHPAKCVCYPGMDQQCAGKIFKCFYLVNIISGYGIRLIEKILLILAFSNKRR